MARDQGKAQKRHEKRYVYTSGWSSAEREPTTIQKTVNKSNDKNLTDPGFDFWNYHIIIFKCTVFNKKITMHKNQ